MKYGLSEKQLQEITAILASYEALDCAILFGSRAIDTYKEASDVDIAIKGEKADWSLAAKIKDHFEEDTWLPFFFDVVAYDSIGSEELRRHIDGKGKVIFRRGMSEWRKVRLGDFFTVRHGFAFKGKNITTEVTNNILVTPSNFHIGGGFKSDKFKYFSGEYPDDYVLQENDIVITMTDLSKETDTLGYSAKIPASKKGEKYLHNQRIGLVQFINNDANSDFLYWHMRTQEYHGYIVGSASGTSIMHTSPTRIEEHEFLIPPLPEQKAIAEVLSSLDDKIDLLHRQNKTLEQMAETLFRQWFVEEAEEDWEEVKIGDFVKTNDNSANKDYSHQIIRYLDTGSLTEGKIVALQEFSFNEAPSRAKRLVQHNDVLLSTVRPNQKHYGIVKNPIENLVVSTGFCVITCEDIDPHFIYILLTTSEMTEYLHSIAEGSTSAYPSLKPTDIEAIEFQLPPDELLQEFAEYCKNAWDKIDKNQTQIRTLESLRDTLLPKLMSGEIRVAMQSTNDTQSNVNVETQNLASLQNFSSPRNRNNQPTHE